MKYSPYFEKFIDFILPPRCIISGDIVEQQGMLAPEVWKELRFISRPFCECCGAPFEFEQEEGALCASCLSNPPSFNKARSALIYGGTGRELILKFKHADQIHAVKAFIPWLKRAGEDLLHEADIIAPVPLHGFRLMKRKYNQAAIIAYELAEREAVDCIPDLLVRTKSTKSQGTMNAKDRAKNVKDVFAVNPSFSEVLQKRNVLLVDDVYTTGATVKECAKALLKGGAATVNILTVARTCRGFEP